MSHKIRREKVKLFLKRNQDIESLIETFFSIASGALHSTAMALSSVSGSKSSFDDIV